MACTQTDQFRVNLCQPDRHGFFYVDTAPGKHEVSTSTEAENKLTFVLEKGEVKYVKMPDLSYIGEPAPKK
jgi:hypothetical protein